MSSAGTTVNRQIVLAARPQGLPAPDDFRLVEGRVPEPRPGQVLIRHTHLGLAPAARLRMSETQSYAQPMALGDVVYGQAAGEVIESRHDGFRPGDSVVSINGSWQEYSVCGGAALTPADLALAPATLWLGLLGTSGMTAYVGLLDIGRPQAGETVVISAASGAVGSAVGQIARIKGCRAVGIVGGAAKCAYVVDELGFDACIDYRAADFAQQLAAACPKGVDVYFENVGGVVRDTVWPLLNQNGRVVLCGLISEYNDAQGAGPGWFPLLTKRLMVQGFILSDRLERRADFVRDMGAWYQAGRIRMREDLSHGLEQAVPAFIGMLQGRNFGKTLVKL
ncbi:MAG: NADP-dependent oxidoreductase [Burkholderiales bacterium]